MRERLKRLLSNPLLFVTHILTCNCPRLIKDDKKYLQTLFFCHFHRKLNLDNPRTFSEKLQWLKLYYHKPLFHIMADKVEAKKYVTQVLGDDFIIPTLGVWESAKDIDFNSLPDKFVIKCNHDSGTGMYICKDKSIMDEESVRRGLAKGLKYDYFYVGREWPYKDIPRRILAEKFMVDESGTELKDYKFFCFNGEPKFLKVDFDRFTDHHANYYSTDWELLDFGEANFPPKPEHIIEKPKNFEEMLSAARTLSKDIPFLRVDFYNINGHIYFGEMTFFPAGGLDKYTPESADEWIGSLLNLPEKSY